MSKRGHDHLQCRIARGIPERKCADCGIAIGQVMHDQCARCQWRADARTPALGRLIAGQDALPWYLRTVLTLPTRAA